MWFYDVQADGFSLDDKRTPQPDKNDLPGLVAEWKERDPKMEQDRSAKQFFVPVADLRANGYDLSLNRYKMTKHEEATCDPPMTIIKRMRDLETDILKDIEELEGMLK